MIEYMNSEDRCIICFKEPDVKPEPDILGEKVIKPRRCERHILYTRE